MKRIPLIALSILLLSMVAVVSVYAQTGESTTLDESSASLSIVETIPVTASVEVNINGQIYQLAIPVMVDIDAQKDLADALLMAQTIDTVGDVQWKITDIAEYEEEFDLSRFSTVEPSSPHNKLVVVVSQLTNLDSEPFSYYPGIYERFAYDDLGNLYESTEQDCDDINPGNTESCTYVFDVPKTTNILGLDVKVLEHKRIPFTAPE